MSLPYLSCCPCEPSGASQPYCTPGRRETWAEPRGLLSCQSVRAAPASTPDVYPRARGRYLSGGLVLGRLRGSAPGVPHSAGSVLQPLPGPSNRPPLRVSFSKDPALWARPPAAVGPLLNWFCLGQRPRLQIKSRDQVGSAAPVELSPNASSSPPTSRCRSCSDLHEKVLCASCAMFEA